MAHYKLVRKSEFFSDIADFIFIQIADRFNNQSFCDQLLNARNPVMMCLNCVRIFSSTRLDDIRIQSSLSQKPAVIKILAGCYLIANCDKVFAYCHALFLRICKARNCFKEAFACIFYYKICKAELAVSFRNIMAFVFSHKAVINMKSKNPVLTKCLV